MSEYIIRYKYGSHSECRYFIEIARENEPSADTCSTRHSDSKSIMKMTLEEARKNVIKIKKIRKGKFNDIEEIQILNAETNERINNEWKYEKISRFELMEL